MTSIHVHARSWQENWEELAVGPSGGQASSKIVRRRDKSIERAFLKILNRQTDAERRARSYREVASLETLDARAVPQLLETNARHYEDTNYLIYLVTEFIDGQNIRDLTEPCSATQAINLSLQLCDILKACHAVGIVHRDIKPENCIVTPDHRFHLVDFGLAFRTDQDVTFETPIGQEIGNRFLRLPEQHADSLNKSDPRTDLTGCVAILFYLLTGKAPRILIDEQGKYPHQRDPASKQIRETDVTRVDRLLALFDRGFQPALDSRFQSADALREAISSAVIDQGGASDNADTIISRIRERTSDPIYLRNNSMMKSLYAIQAQIHFLTDRIIGSLNGAFTMLESGHVSDVGSSSLIYRLGFMYSQNTRVHFMPNYHIQHLGNEIILKVMMQEPNGDREDFSLRVPGSPGTLDVSTIDRLHTYLLGKLEQIMIIHSS